MTEDCAGRLELVMCRLSVTVLSTFVFSYLAWSSEVFVDEVNEGNAAD